LSLRAAAPTPRPRLSYAAVNYRPRVIGFVLFALMLLAVPPEESTSVRLGWLLLCLAWPHAAYLIARRRSDQRAAETTNIIVDCVLAGCIASAYALRLWPTAAMFCIGTINALLSGGPVLLLLGAVLWASALGASMVAFGIRPHLDTEPAGTALGIAAIVGYIAMIGTTAYRLRQRQRATRAALESEEEKSAALLLNVFPAPVIPRLRDGESPIADQFADVTVVFADIVEFTPLAERLGPKRTVLLLNDLFAKFDAAAMRLGIEKIETTGDGYLAVGGAPKALDDHPKAAADFALAVLDAARTTVTPDGHQVHVRVGLHTGPIFAGVIGESRFHYKIFGETVNVASRVQSQARARTALVSEATFKRIQHSHALREYATLELKGHGPMRTFWLSSN
jgi:class 3 adenylate cyclase